MKLTRIKSLVFISVVMVMCFGLATQAMGVGGSSGEPGAGCSVACTLSYITPPYTGNLSVVWNSNGFVTATGILYQVGKSDCTITLVNVPLSATGVSSLDIFKELKSKDIRSECWTTDEIGDQDCLTAAGAAAVEVVGAGYQEFIGDIMSLDVVVMPVKCKM